MGLLQPSGRPSMSIKNSIRHPLNLKLLVKLIGLFAAVLLIVLVVIYYLNNHKSDSNVTKKPDPCALFTLQNAKSLLGNLAEKSDYVPITQESTKNIDVANCSYQVNQQGSTSSLKIASVIIRSPKDSLGKAYNQHVFYEGKPQGTQDVGGYGDKSFWNPSLGTLNVLKISITYR
jgi:hypothetical protein